MDKESMMQSKWYKMAGIFFAYVLCQLKFLTDEWFGTDELDVMVIGKGIRKGLLLYVDEFSQHMPFSYYFSALFDFLGADTVRLQRIAYYLFFAAMWVLIINLYQDIVDKRILILYPFLHFCMIQNYDLGTQILSEHLAGIGAILMLLEFLRFVETRDINWRSCVILSISIVLTFGTVFIAAFPVFFIGVGVVGTEIKWQVTDQEPVKQWVLKLIKKYGKLVFVVAIPWVILLSYYVATRSLSEFILGAYTINREIYPEYIAGFGGNILTSFLTPIQTLFEYIVNVCNQETYGYVSMIQIVFVGSSIVFIYDQWKKNGVIVALTIFLFTYSLALRGMFNFHSTQNEEVLAFMTAYVFVTYLYKCKETFLCKRKWIQLSIIGIFLLVLSGYFKDFSEVSELPILSDSESGQSKIMAAITEEDEGIWEIVFANSDLMMADRAPVYSAVTTPWTWKAYGKQQFKELKENPPRVAYYYDGFSVWEHMQSDYAPKVIEYLKENYTLMPDTSNVYVRNDYYEEACEKVEAVK